jgi:hypothetical protein
MPMHVANCCRGVHRHRDHEDGDGGGDRPPNSCCDDREPDEHPGPDGAGEHPPGASFGKPIGERRHVEHHPTAVKRRDTRTDSGRGPRIGEAPAREPLDDALVADGHLGFPTRNSGGWLSGSGATRGSPGRTAGFVGCVPDPAFPPAGPRRGWLPGASTHSMLGSGERQARPCAAGASVSRRWRCPRRPSSRPTVVSVRSCLEVKIDASDLCSAAKKQSVEWRDKLLWFARGREIATSGWSDRARIWHRLVYPWRPICRARTSGTRLPRGFEPGIVEGAPRLPAAHLVVSGRRKTSGSFLRGVGTADNDALWDRSAAGRPGSRPDNRGLNRKRVPSGDPWGYWVSQERCTGNLSGQAAIRSRRSALSRRWSRWGPLRYWMWSAIALLNVSQSG